MLLRSFFQHLRKFFSLTRNRPIKPIQNLSKGEYVSQHQGFTDQAQQRADLLTMLNEVSREISTLTDLPSLMEKVHQQIHKVLPADFFFIGLYDKDNNELSFPFMYDDGKRWEQPPNPISDDTFSGKTILTGKPLLINEWSGTVKNGEPPPVIVGDNDKITRSLMFTPMIFGREIIGVISAQSYDANAYNEEDLNLLSGITNQVAIAIQNSRLLEETKQNAQHLSTLNELGRAVTELRALPDLLEVVYRQIKQNLNMDAFFVGIYQPESNTVTYPIMYDDGIKYSPKPDVLTKHSFMYELLHGEKAKCILRTKEEVELTSSDQGMLGNVNRISASLMLAPLKVGEQVIGLISVQSYSLNAYTEDDLNLLIGIGNQVGVAIQNARLLEEIRQNAEQLAILNEVGASVSKIMKLPDLLEVVYEQGKKSISLDAFFVGLYHPDTQEISFPIIYDSGKRHTQDSGPLSTSSFLNRFLKGEKTILINRTPEELAKNAPILTALGEKDKRSASIMAAPLISRNDVIGMISAQSYSLNAYGEKDAELLKGMASQVSIAIENSRLFAAAQQEIKERQRAEMEAQRERDFALQIMNTLGQGVAVLLLDGVYEYVNPAYAQMLGYDPEDMIGELSEYFVLPDEIEKYRNQRQQLQTGKTTTYESRLKHKDGHIVHVLITGVPRYANGRIIGSIAAITDLTDRIRTEIERENLLTQMENKNAELEKFTYTVSHDLRSPIVTISGFLGFLENDLKNGDYEKIPKTIQRIHAATKKMDQLLNELLELSRIGRLVNLPTEVPFGELVSETLELVDGQLMEKQVKVKVEADLPTVNVDRIRIVEVLQNLITNAAKFMGEQEKPTIDIGMKTINDESVFFIKDNGIGIAPEFHDRIFGLFNKLDQFSDGTGIGLALVKRIIEVHGGRIWVESDLGKGTTFFFTLENIKPEETA